MTTLTFLWHFHQPDYRRHGETSAILPWVRLHAARGYSDLLHMLQRNPHFRCCVNFSGILLEQIEAACAGQTDVYLDLSSRPVASLDDQEREFLVRRFFSANPTTLIRPHRRYWELYQRREAARASGSDTQLATLFADDELTDLIVWFNLAWIGFSGQQRPDVRQLISQGRGFSFESQLRVLEAQRSIMSTILPGYAELARQNVIELSFTPHYHPILPLLCDLAAIGRRNDADPLPEFRYPKDAAEQIRRGMEQFQASFGLRPRGAWPAEGSVSDEALGLLSEAGLSWAATDQQNLPPEAGPLGHTQPWMWKQNERELAMFFRDTRLADNIGFDYSSWNPVQAATHLLDMAQALGAQSSNPRPVVTIALDGENPWEHYAGGGEAFLTALGERLRSFPALVCQTPSEALEALNSSGSLPAIGRIHAGSWIGGNFDIWSRHAEDRRAWRLLAHARSVLGEHLSPDVYQLLLAAEGSDSFWWYGDDFVSDSNEQFDALFRGNLISAYEVAGLPVPSELYEPICAAYRTAGVAEPGGIIHPALDGRITTYFEWLGSVEVDIHAGQSSMARSALHALSEMRYGFDTESLYVRLGLNGDWRDAWHLHGGQVHICLLQGQMDVCVPIVVPKGFRPGPIGPNLGLDEVLEIRAPITELGLEYGSTAFLWIELTSPGLQPARFPHSGRVAVRIIPRDFCLKDWVV